ncbi:MAG: sulfotransferase [Bacteroidetes bacterium]|jgi:hypothetical protein|nr:sulfotransferase [Bacteroidota bacterium]
MMDYKEINKIPMFFIVGRARSGTTLLQTMLDAHPSVIVPSESCVLMHLKSKYFHNSDWSNSKVDTFLTDIFEEKKLKRFWAIDIEKIRQQIYEIPKALRNFTLLCKIVYINFHSLFGQDKISLIGDKNPIYTIFLNDLLELFPEAKFIHIIRDYRANVVSNREAFSLKNIATLAHAWKYHNQKVEKFKALHAERFLELKYENLATTPDIEMQKICNFLKIPYVPTVLNYHHTINEKVNEKVNEKENSRFNRIHGNLLKPVNTDKIESWKKKLSENDLALTEYITGSFAVRYGYSRSTLPGTTLSMVLKSVYGFLNCRAIHTIIKIYYYSPFILKKALSVFSKKMNDWLKIKNYYNQSDFG